MVKATEALDPTQIEFDESAIIVKFEKKKYAKEFNLQSLFDSILNPGFDNEKEARKFLRNKVHVPNLKMVKTFSADTVSTDDTAANPAKKDRRITAKILREERRQRKRKKEIGLNRTYTIEVPEGETANSLLSQLKSDPNIAYAEKLIKVETFATNFNDRHWDESSRDWSLSYEEMWGPRVIEADEAWDTTQGEGVVVSVIDTGVDYNHPDLWDNIWVDPDIVNDVNGDGEVDLNDVDSNGNGKIESSEIIQDMFGYDLVSNTKDPMDRHGHGTHCAGTIAAVADNNIGIVGVAPKAKIMAVKGLGDGGSASDRSLANSVVWSADHGADVISASWGGRGSSQLVKDAFDYAKSLGVVCIVAAGNDNSDARNYFPAAFDNVVTVGASTYTDGRASFSNWGPAVDIAAPGGGEPSDAPNGSGVNNILSTMTQGHRIASSSLQVGDLEENKYGYYRIAGTSMACPHVSGVAALVKANRPELSNDEIEQLLVTTSDDINTDRAIGGKRVNALRAIGFESNVPRAVLNVDASDTTVSGKIRGKMNLIGTAKGQGFVNYKLAYRISGADTWAEIKDSDSQVTSDVLFRNFDTTDVVDGSYDFRLQVFINDGNIFEDFITIFINNEGALRINSCQQLQDINNDLTGEYILTRDIDCTETKDWNNGAGFIPIGTRNRAFEGDFNGNGHVIKNLYMNFSDDEGLGGLFGEVNGGEIRRVGLINSDISSAAATGSLVGYQRGNSFIIQSFAIGKVGNGTSATSAGGLVALQKGSQIIDSYAQVEVNIPGFGGGLVGIQYNNSQIINSYSTEPVTAGLQADPFVSDSRDSQVTSSYYDRDVSGMDSSLIGQPRSTNEMYTRSNFEDWDFQDTWSINNGNDYPRLRAFNYNPGLDEENEAATNIVISDDEIVENSPVDTVIGVVSVVDPNPGDSHTLEILSIDGDANSTLFRLDNVNNELLLNGPVDFEAKETHFVTIQATDFEGLTFSKEIRVNVLNLIESTEDDDILLDGRDLNENSPVGFVIGNLSNLQEANGNTYRYEMLIVENNFINRFISPANRFFRIDEENRLVVKEEINYERYTEVPVRIRSIDQNNVSLIKDFVIKVNNVKDEIGIYNCKQLQDIEDNLDADYFLAQTIDCSDTREWNPLFTDKERIETSPRMGFLPVGGKAKDDVFFRFFTGTLDGKNRKIKGLFINDFDTETTGIFGYLYGASVKNLVIEGGSIRGASLVGSLAGAATIDSQILNVHVIGTRVQGRSYVGGIVGNLNYSTLELCSIRNASVAGTKRVGGLIGGSQIYGQLKNSYSEANIFAAQYAGGLTGRIYLFSTIENCYAAGEVTAPNDVGGLVGYDQDSIDVFNFYKKGLAAKGLKIENVTRDPKVINSFFDNITSLQDSSEGGTGLPTADMMQQATFTDWDFDNIWVIDEGNDYPRFILDPTGFEDEEEDIPEDNPVVPTEPPLGDDNPPIIAPEDPDGDDGAEEIGGEDPVDTVPDEEIPGETETPDDDTPEEEVPPEEDPVEETPDDGDLVDQCINNLGKLVHLNGLHKVRRRFKDIDDDIRDIISDRNDNDFDFDDRLIDQGQRDKRKRQRKKRRSRRNGQQDQNNNSNNGISGTNPVNPAPVDQVNNNCNISSSYFKNFKIYESTPGGTINFKDYEIKSYGIGKQDLVSKYSIRDRGDTLVLTHNTWKQIDIPYTVTENTMIEFDFRSFTEGEIHGFGLDEDSHAQTGFPRAFKVYGTQTQWRGMTQDFDTYDGSGKYVHYTIPVGEYFTGSMNHIFFFNDNDLPKECNDAPVIDPPEKEKPKKDKPKKDKPKDDTPKQDDTPDQDDNNQGGGIISCDDVDSGDDDITDDPGDTTDPDDDTDGVIDDEIPGDDTTDDSTDDSSDDNSGDNSGDDDQDNNDQDDSSSGGTDDGDSDEDDSEATPPSQPGETPNDDSESEEGDNAPLTVPISDCEGLQEMRKELDASYFLLNDIDCSETRSWNEGAGFVPVGSPNQPFFGSFNGAGFEIQGLVINRDEFRDIGLFGATFNATIHDVTLTDFNIKGKNNTAAVVGSAFDSDIYNINIKNLTLAGQNRNTGSLAGLARESTFNKIYAEAKVEGNKFTGGLIGSADEVTVNQSYAYGIFLGDKELGGIIGRSKNSKVISSYTNSITVGSNKVGGLIGVIEDINEITKSYAASTVNGARAGGLVGFYLPKATIATFNSYFDKDVSGIVASPVGGVSYESEEMYLSENFTDWDFETIWFIDDGNDYPRFNDEPVKTLALVEQNDEDSGLGIDTDGIKRKVINISDCRDLQAMKNNLKGNYVLKRNIDCAESALWNDGQGFEPIGVEQPFTGRLDGKGHYIKDLFMNRPNINRVGLFSLTSGARITDLRFINVDIIGSNDVGVVAGELGNSTVSKVNVVSGDLTAGAFRAGAIAGNARSSRIFNSFTDLDITADREAGGIIGKCLSCSVIESASYGNILTDTYSGGLIGFATSPVIKNSYSVAELEAERFIGGLIAYNENTANISNCYASNSITATTGALRDAGGLIGTGNTEDLVSIKSSFWNSNTSGRSTSFGGGEAKTTEELRNRSTFKGWDFKNIWSSLVGKLPVLRLF
ncbi:MAG: S8 family serine peptidase [Candidatus Caenarcaniphilales bacterium]|nr:S8 family serine peptidase [Candidatus Caenarcaniphilales bacterium]